MKPTLSVMVLILVGALALTACGGATELVVTDPWARAGQVGDNSAVYFVIQNPRMEADVLLRASSEAAAAVELHMSVMGEPQPGGGAGTAPQGPMGGEVMRMMLQESVAVPGRSTVGFEPGGLHVMLVDLRQNLVVGQTLALTLVFQQAGEITLEVPVEMR